MQTKRMDKDYVYKITRDHVKRYRDMNVRSTSIMSSNP